MLEGDGSANNEPGSAAAEEEEGGGGLGVVGATGESPRRNKLKMDKRFDCGSWDEGCRLDEACEYALLVVGGEGRGGGGLFVALEAAGEVLSGLAMRKPPNDWERLRSPSMAAAKWVWL